MWRRFTVMLPYAVANGAARALLALGFLWVAVWAAIGATPAGRAWYARLAAALVSSRDAKGGLPLLVLAAPLLLPAALAQLLTTREPETPEPRRHGRLPFGLHRISIRPGGDVNFALASLAVVVPCTLYAVGSIRRHVQEDPTGTRDVRLMDAANALGMAALVALPLSLPVVARNSVLLRLADWNPARAARLHAWVGRAVVVGATGHSGLHLARWVLAGESLLSMLLPPRPCWSDASFQPNCRNGTTECSCSDLFRNMTGILAATGLLLIAASSLEVVRRGAYAVFYRIHILAGPLVVLAIAVHYSRAMLYLAGGLVFYMASTFPVRVESFLRQRSQRQRVRIVQTQIIAPTDCTARPGAAATSCVALTVEATDGAMARFRACQYIRLHAPAVSAMSHPFSINTVPNQSHWLRIILRVSGPFTTHLASHLITHQAPEVYLDGFYGPSKRVQQALRHDTVVLVAGGIGITAYLSLIHRLQSIGSPHIKGFRLRRIVMHWMCRDASLIRYIKQEYLEPLRHLSINSTLDIRVIIYETGPPIESSWSLSDSGDLEKPPDKLQQHGEQTETCGMEDSSPFAPSYFEPASGLCYRANWLHFAVFSLMSVGGLHVIWICYTLASKSNNISGRIWAPLALVAVELSIAIVGGIVARRLRREEDPERLPEWTQLITSAEDSLELAMSKVGDLSAADEPADSLRIAKSSDGPLVVLEERLERPSVHQFVNIFDSARDPGLFVCGPESLLVEIRQVVQDRCMARLQQCIQGGAKICLYEESFQT